MSVAFSLFIVLDNPQETAQVKEFVKEYYADLDCISENVDSSSNEKSVCIESLAIGFSMIPKYHGFSIASLQVRL